MHHLAAPLAPAPTLALLAERQPPQRVIWIADGSGSLYAVPTPDEQGVILGRVLSDGERCRDCPFAEHDGDNRHRPRTTDCGLRRGAAHECPGYADELAAWEQEQAEALGDDEFAALIGGAA